MRACHQLLRRLGYSQRAQNAHSVRWLFVFSLSAHLRPVARTIIFPCLPLPAATVKLPTRPSWGQGERLAGGRQKTDGNQGVADKTATQTKHYLSKKCPLRQGLREWLAFVPALPCASASAFAVSASLVASPTNANSLRFKRKASPFL